MSTYADEITRGSDERTKSGQTRWLKRCLSVTTRYYDDDQAQTVSRTKKAGLPEVPMCINSLSRVMSVVSGSIVVRRTSHSVGRVCLFRSQSAEGNPKQVSALRCNYAVCHKVNPRRISRESQQQHISHVYACSAASPINNGHCYIGKVLRYLNHSLS